MPMQIIGTFLKKTNGLVYRRVQKKGAKKGEWTDDLINLLKTANSTTFGVRHRFVDILKSEDPVKSYQINVPITDYDEFYEKWLKAGMVGLKDHTWPGRIGHYALSSGTTGSPSKRIPITKQMIRSFQKSSVGQLAMLHELNLSNKFYGGHLLAVGGSSRLTKKVQYLEG
ncbi:MAG: GH3 auxin-responsive promoter family protein, partial [Crocinitomicaceae bacterium]|nr:GH3 auxin-responsive promoter family protein [Crocinitomicaceae bacterium]